MDVMLLIIAGVFITALLVAFLIYQNNEAKQDKKRTTSNPTIPASSKPKKVKSKPQRPKEQEDKEEIKDATKKSRTRKKTVTSSDDGADEMESVLEFLKGKDNSEIYKEANKQLKKEAKKKKKQQKVADVEVADQSSEESGEGEYTMIEKKKAQIKSKDPITPAKQDKEKPYKKKKGSIFKADISKAMRDAEKNTDKEKVREIKETHKEEATVEHKGQEEVKKEKEPKVFPPREPPKISKEELDAPSLDDMLNSITKWSKISI